jgi:hypothetical protein
MQAILSNENPQRQPHKKLRAPANEERAFATEAAGQTSLAFTSVTGGVSAWTGTAYSEKVAFGTRPLRVSTTECSVSARYADPSAGEMTDIADYHDALAPNRTMVRHALRAG